MNRRSLYTVLSFAIMLVVGMSLVISTLHSHHHLKWNHPNDFADTGHCITTNTTLCPICGYIVKGSTTTVLDVNTNFSELDITIKPQTNTTAKLFSFPVLGRSPPYVV